MDDDQPRQQIVDVFGQLADVLPYDQPVYRRTIQTRPVTFTCQQCRRTLTNGGPGPIRGSNSVATGHYHGR